MLINDDYLCVITRDDGRNTLLTIIINNHNYMLLTIINTIISINSTYIWILINAVLGIHTSNVLVQIHYPPEQFVRF